ncbi:MAG: hypothetical protein OXC38_09250 [Gammaproteobacteria bacterium]|nr:hypothetical protein [Gammaproteobacteria bacterium]
MSKSANDLAWEKILEEITAVEAEIDRRGHYDIESQTIKKYREPRLACKIDYRQNTPDPLKKEKLSVLAIRNGCYRLARTDPFININQKQCRDTRHPDHFSIPEHIQVLTPRNISSESKALDAAFVSGMLNDVVGDRLSPVLRGREYCKRIGFSLPDRESDRPVKYAIEKVQLEVDGGYEGQAGLHLFEAKLALSDNMNLRQLLYPQLHYSDLFKGQKDVKTYVMFYEQGRGYFHFYRFNTEHGHLRFSDYRRCALEVDFSSNFSWDDLHAVEVDIDKTGYGAPFPQADRFDKVLALFLKLSEVGAITKERLFSSYNIVPRQHDYYVNTLRWMGLAEIAGRGKGLCRLTSEGKRIAQKSEREILQKMAKIIFSNDLCNQFISSDDPDIREDIRKRNGFKKNSTFYRRIQTIRGWKKYLQEVLSI